MIEHLLFACCLEDAHHDAAEEAFAALVHTFFDWNEVRVTSISELSEVMACLPDPRAAANRIKRVLHAVFEATFSFDLEDQRKKNLGPTIAWFEKLDGTTPFVVSYVVQAALGGHAIPIDTGTMAVLRVLDLVTDKDVTAGVVPGLERAVAKSKGVEFGSMLHELGADYLRQSLLRDDPRYFAANQARMRGPAAEAAGRSLPCESRTSRRAAGEARQRTSRFPGKIAGKEEADGVRCRTCRTGARARKEEGGLAAGTAAEARCCGKNVFQPAASKNHPASEGLSKRKPR